MSLSWCKVASNLDSHPRVRKAGREGREVFLFALRRNAEPGHKTSGRLKFEDLDPDYLADILMMPRDAAVTGVRHAVTAGLLAEDSDFYVIVGWEDGWGKSTKDGAERTKKWREGKKSQPVTESVTNVTSPNVTQRHGDVGDALEETRGEETRLEEKREKRRTRRASRPVAPELPLPADWKPNEKHAELATKRGLTLEFQAAKFMAHAETHARTAASWNGAFSQWLLSGDPSREPRPQTQRPVGRAEPRPEADYEADMGKAF
jgi:hypothetical protein